MNREDGAELIDAVRTPSFNFQSRADLLLILDTVGSMGLEILDLTAEAQKFDPVCREVSPHKIECIVRTDLEASFRCGKKWFKLCLNCV